MTVIAAKDPVAGLEPGLQMVFKDCVSLAALRGLAKAPAGR